LHFDKDREATETGTQSSFQYTTLKTNEIVGAVVASAAGVSQHPSHGGLHEEINLNDRFKLELSKTQKGERKFLTPSIFQKEFEYPSVPTSKVKAKAGVKTNTSAPQIKEKEGRTQEGGKEEKEGSIQAILNSIEPSQPAAQSYFASANDFNSNLLKDKYEEHLSTYKAFNSYVQFCNKVYWGPNQTNVASILGPNNEPNNPQNAPTPSTTTNAAGGGNAVSSASQTSQFIQNLIQQQVKSQNQKSRYQLTAYDILFNPLRKDHPFEDWSPKEISRFQACFLIYGKAFGEFRVHLPRKSYSEIQEFYRAWKHTPFYREWKKQNKQ
jgi:hypothetical protein